MALTEKQMRLMTLGEIEALASRVGAAAKTIREAQELMGGRMVPVAMSFPTDPPDDWHNVSEAAMSASVSTNKGAPNWRPDELALRERMRASRTALEEQAKVAQLEELPPGIAKAEAKS